MAKLVKEPGDLSDFQPKDIVIAKGTDFDLALIMRIAGAIVTEEGGLLSHAAVLAREQGVPCVINVAGATKIIQHGDELEVNGNTGTVTVCTPRVTRSVSTQESSCTSTEFLTENLSDPAIVGNKAHVLALLADTGLPVPSPLISVPTFMTERLLRELESGRYEIAIALIYQLRQVFNGSVNIRSSATYEDTSSGSGAGLLESAICVELEDKEFVSSLETVLHSGLIGHGLEFAQETYHLTDDIGFSVLFSPYLTFDFQGFALHDDDNTVTVEFLGHSADKHLQINVPLEVTVQSSLHNDSREGVRENLWDSVCRIASLATRAAHQLDQPVTQIEWGIDSNNEVWLLQARAIDRV